VSRVSSKLAHAWKDTSAQGAGEAPMRGAGTAVAGASITATVGGDSEGVGADGADDMAALGRAEGAE
jgi:hypothetical protein